MAATSVESPSPASLHKGSPSLTMPSSPQLFSFSPSSDKRFWNTLRSRVDTLRSRVDTLLENRKPLDQSLPTQMNPEVIDRKRRMKEDSMLLLRGFDSDFSGSVSLSLIFLIISKMLFRELKI